MDGGQRRLGEAADDELTIYAQEQNAALITHDAEFSERRRKSVIGQHIHLKCREWDAVDVLRDNLDEILTVLGRRPDVWIRLSPDAEYKLSFKWE
jgi:predicted nuclease of predicted toxin-antitoxin system